jgi:endonuclease G
MKPYILTILLFATFWTFAQQEAVTPDGKKVILNADGTWTATTEADHNIASHLELPKAKPNDVIINHTGYTVSYNTTANIANWVAYDLTAEETVPVVKRNDHFIPDPLLKYTSATISDYKGTGYDRGHLAPAADMCYSYQAMVESFYLTNISPQNPSFNRGIWEKLEKQVRTWAVEDTKVYVVTGTIISKSDPVIGITRITVPHSFYKVVLDYTEPNIKGIAFIIPNEASKEPLQYFAVTIDSVEKVTGVDFFYQIPVVEQKVFESSVDLKKWSWTSTLTAGNKEKSGTSVQCQGTTKAGALCKNKTLNPNGFCHLHQSQVPGAAKPETINSSTTKRSVTVRCSTTTKKGSQCSRMTFSPNGRCWQHGGD